MLLLRGPNIDAAGGLQLQLLAGSHRTGCDVDGALLEYARTDRQAACCSDVRPQRALVPMYPFVILLAARIVLCRGVDLVGHGGDIDVLSGEELTVSPARADEKINVSHYFAKYQVS